MNQIEQTMTAGDVIEFTMHDQRHTAVVMLMTDDDLVLLDLLDGDRPAWPASRAFKRRRSSPQNLERCWLPPDHQGEPATAGRSYRGPGLLSDAPRGGHCLCAIGGEDPRPNDATD
jgi:hypothetical protein